jgi:hypothetical protein
VEITLAGGAVVDLATRADADERHGQLAKLLERPAVHYQRVTGVSPSPAGAGPLVLDLGRPAMGMIWLPQWITITGDDVFGGAIANVTCAVFAGRVARPQELVIGPPVRGFDLAACILTGGAGGLSIPNTTGFPDKTPVFTNEHLYVIVTGTGVNAGAGKYTATAGVLELPFNDESLTW